MAAVNYDGVVGVFSLPAAISPVGIASIGVSTTAVLVTFTEPVDPVSAQVAGNYQLSGNATVSSAVLQSNDCSVLLTTSTLVAGSYTLTVSNVYTAIGVALPTESVTLTAPAALGGSINVVTGGVAYTGVGPAPDSGTVWNNPGENGAVPAW